MQIVTNKKPHYHEQLVQDFDGNPLVESLNPFPMSDDEVYSRLKQKPEFNSYELELPAALRMSFPSRLKNFTFPTTEQIKLLKYINLQILDGYRTRNPFTPEGQAKLHNIKVEKQDSGTISFVTGPSGVGKTRGIDSILESFGATVICHESYRGEPFIEKQIVFIKRNVPGQCTQRIFCKRFGEQADALIESNLYTKHFKNKALTEEDYVSELSRIVKNQHVGVLVIDEFQNLLLSNSDTQKELIALLINMRDELGIPIVLVGTYRAADILMGDASIARRLAEGGYHEIKRAETPADEGWQQFCKLIWKYQWLKEPIPFSDEIIDLFYNYSQGIIGILITLFIRSQIFALDHKIEYVDAKMIGTVFKEGFKPLHGIINVLRSNKRRMITKYDDLLPRFTEEMNEIPFNKRLIELQKKFNEQHKKYEEFV